MIAVIVFGTASQLRQCYGLSLDSAEHSAVKSHSNHYEVVTDSMKAPRRSPAATRCAPRSLRSLRCLRRLARRAPRPFQSHPTWLSRPGGTERGRPLTPARTMQAPQRSEERSESRPGERPGAFMLFETLLSTTLDTTTTPTRNSLLNPHRSTAVEICRCVSREQYGHTRLSCPHRATRGRVGVQSPAPVGPG